MSRQQTRSSGDGAIDPSLVQKKRARHRLVGAICLCLLAAAVVPLVLESEPRPRERELPIELAPPERQGDGQLARPAAGDTAPAPPGVPAAAQSTVKTVTPPSAANDTTTGVARLDAKPSTTGDVGRADKSEASKAEAAKAEAARQQAARQDPSKPASPRHDPAGHDAARQDLAKQDFARQEAARQEAARQESLKQEAARQEAAKAKGGGASKTPSPQEKSAGRGEDPDVARLMDRNAPAGTSAGVAAARRYLVQIGAYSNVQSARTVSDRVVGVGLRPYQETVKTAQGDWIRVRVGPFTTRQDAERAQQDLKRVGVTAAIIAL